MQVPSPSRSSDKSQYRAAVGHPQQLTYPRRLPRKFRSKRTYRQPRVLFCQLECLAEHHRLFPGVSAYRLRGETRLCAQPSQPLVRTADRRIRNEPELAVPVDERVHRYAPGLRQARQLREIHPPRQQRMDRLLRCEELSSKGIRLPLQTNVAGGTRVEHQVPEFVGSAEAVSVDIVGAIRRENNNGSQQPRAGKGVDLGRSLLGFRRCHHNQAIRFHPASQVAHWAVA